MNGEQLTLEQAIGRPIPADEYDFDGRCVYLSGKMTGLPRWNRDEFMKQARRLHNAGAIYVYNPAEMAPRTKTDPRGHEWWMRRSIEELSDGAGDEGGNTFYHALALIPGWEDSPGSRVEVIVADALGIDIVAL